MTASPTGSTIPIIDSNGDSWTVVAGVVQKNGVAAGLSANVTLLLFFNGVIYQQNKAGGWWSWTGNPANWTGSADPRVPVANTPPPVANTPPPVANTPPPPVVNGVRVTGANLTINGQVITMNGPNFSGCEMGDQQSAGRYLGLAAMPSSFYTAYAAKYSVKGFAITAFRFPFNHNCLFGPNATQYRTALQNIAAAVTAGKSVAGNPLICNFDAHWDAPNTPSGGYQAPIGQGCMPTADNAIRGWTWMAQTFKNNLFVTFELMNEPFGDNVYGDEVSGAAGAGKWALALRDGGSIAPFLAQNNEVSSNPIQNMNGGASVQLVGYNAILAAIRAQNAENVCFASPIGWAGEIETMLAMMPTDSAKQLGVSWHVYGYEKGISYPLTVRAQYPIVITETYGFNASLNAASSNAGYPVAQKNGIGVMWWSSSTNNWGASTDGTSLAAKLLNVAPWASPATAP